MKDNKKLVKIGSFIVIVAFVGLVLFIFGVSLDSGVMAEGKIIPEAKSQTIQHLEGGIIKEFFVKEGDVVKEGDKIAQIEPIVAQAELNAVLNEKENLQAILERLLVQSKQQEKILAQTPSAQVQRELLKLKEESFKKELQILESKIEQLNQQVDFLNNQSSSLERVLANHHDSYISMKTLYDQRYIDNKRFFEAENSYEEAKESVKKNYLEIKNTKEKISELELQKNKLNSDYNNAVFDELAKVNKELFVVLEREKTITNKNTRMVLLSPCNGIVKSLSSYLKGSVVPSGGIVAEITPDDGKVVLEAQILPDDIDVVHVGLKALVHVSAYKARNINAINATVIFVSPDVFKDERLGSNYYKAFLKLDESELQKESIELTAGMNAQIEIVTGERSVASYLFAPVKNSMRGAFKEE